MNKEGVVIVYIVYTQWTIKRLIVQPIKRLKQYHGQERGWT